MATTGQQQFQLQWQRGNGNCNGNGAGATGPGTTGQEQWQWQWGKGNRSNRIDRSHCNNRSIVRVWGRRGRLLLRLLFRKISECQKEVQINE
jgi:hypothetical protein